MDTKRYKLSACAFNSKLQFEVISGSKKILERLAHQISRFYYIDIEDSKIRNDIPTYWRNY